MVFICVNVLGGDKIWYTFTGLLCQTPKSHIQDLGFILKRMFCSFRFSYFPWKDILTKLWAKENNAFYANYGTVCWINLRGRLEANIWLLVTHVMYGTIRSVLM